MIEGLRADTLPDVDKGRVAGVLHGLGEGLGTVTLGFPAADWGTASLDADAARTEKAIRQAHRPFLERHRERDDLEGRAGLVGIGERLVAPLPGLGLGKQALGFLLTLRRVDPRTGFIAHVEEVVQVVAA